MARERQALSYDELDLIVKQSKAIHTSDYLTEDQKIEQIYYLARNDRFCVRF